MIFRALILIAGILFLNVLKITFVKPDLHDKQIWIWPAKAGGTLHYEECAFLRLE